MNTVIEIAEIVAAVLFAGAGIACLRLVFLVLRGRP